MPTVTQTLTSWISNAREGEHGGKGQCLPWGDTLRGGATANQMKFIFSSNKNVLELDNGDVCAILYMDFKKTTGSCNDNIVGI